jgi:hypothetical protein
VRGSRWQQAADRYYESVRMSWVAHAAYVGGKRNAYKVLMGKPEWKKRLLGRVEHRDQFGN